MLTLKDYLEILPVFQSARLRRDYVDLARTSDCQAVGEFFFTELYGPHDFSARNEELRRAHQFLPMIPGVSAQDVEQSLELIELTGTLDTALAHQLLMLNAPVQFDEPMYEDAYRRADNYQLRMLQLDLVRAVLTSLQRLTRLPLLGMALRHSRGAAQLARLEHFHNFLCVGYNALCQARDTRYFIDTVHERELARLNRIYRLAPGSGRANRQRD